MKHDFPIVHDDSMSECVITNTKYRYNTYGSRAIDLMRYNKRSLAQALSDATDYSVSYLMGLSKTTIAYTIASGPHWKMPLPTIKKLPANMPVPPTDIMGQNNPVFAGWLVLGLFTVVVISLVGILYP